LAKKNNKKRKKRTIHKGIWIIKQLNANLFEGKPQKSKLKKRRRKHQLKTKEKNQENSGESTKQSLIFKTCNSLNHGLKFN
jgi:hypothetical protein